jgi:hypothetical protein
MSDDIGPGDVVEALRTFPADWWGPEVVAGSRAVVALVRKIGPSHDEVARIFAEDLNVPPVRPRVDA